VYVHLRKKKATSVALQVHFTTMHQFTIQRPSCACRTHSNTSAKSFPPVVSLLPFRPSTLHRRLAREHIRPVWDPLAFLWPASALLPAQQLSSWPRALLEIELD
jgi:hypothetical protein